MRSWGEPPVRALVRQALRWAAGLEDTAQDKEREHA
jgi:hypothetical protein